MMCTKAVKPYASARRHDVITASGHKDFIEEVEFGLGLEGRAGLGWTTKSAQGLTDKLEKQQEAEVKPRLSLGDERMACRWSCRGDSWNASGAASGALAEATGATVPLGHVLERSSLLS